MSTDRQPTRPETDLAAASARRRPSDRRRGHERLLAGRYRLAAPIGEGGMATIYQARDEQLGREVAVKILRPQFGADPTFSARFRQEAQSAAGLAHPNVVAIFDYGAEDGAQFIVMELVRGRTLAALLAERGPLPVDMAVEVAAQVASALEAAHRNGLVHRDVKPGNILVSDDGRVKVADFGIARAVSEASLTSPGTTLGSVHYFSPEQARGEPVTGSSDVYSLGIVLFEMLTGRRPFEAETAMGVVMRRIRERAPSVRAFDPTLPQPLVRIVDRALARRPSGRFASAAAFESALRSLDLPIAWAPRAEVPATPAPSTRSGADRFGSGPASSVRQGTVYGRVPGAARPVHRDGAAAGRPGAPRPASHQRPASGPGPARWRSPVAAPSSDEPRRRLPAPLFLVLGLVAALGLVGGALAFDAIGRDSRAEQPAPTRVADGPTAAPTERPTARPTPAPTPAPTPPRTPEPTPEPTVRPTETPTPQPTARPTPPSTVGRPSLTPAQTVAYWYALVDDGEFDRAAALWSRRMRANYPPERYIDGRFAATDSIEARRARTTSVGDGRARVAVDVIEIVDGERRRWVGSWDLVRGPNGWLLDDPNF